MAPLAPPSPRFSALPPNPWGGRSRKRIGVLGGSFNPAHAGHLHVSLQALHCLGLDELWWLVSPQNPLKPQAGMAPLAERMADARTIARHPKIRVTGLEARLGTRFTADTLGVLVRRFPETRFVWLMGADNLAQIPDWDRWETIFRTVAVAVFDRSPYSYQSLAGKAARRFARVRLPVRQAGLLADVAPPVWTFLHLRRHPASATAIRRGRASQAISD
jgi:nicotinate-nucleotide adenylyltransferase